MNKEIKLPKNWKWVRLAEVGKIISGGTPSTVISEYWNGNINWIAPSDLTGYKKIKIKSGKKSITEAGLKKSSAKLMPKGSVLFSSRAPIGYVAIADEELCTNQGFKSVIPNDFVDNFFLYYYLKASKQEAEKVASGTTFKEISLRSFSELKFPLPPLETQQAIVSKIEELFSELDKGIEDLKTAQLQLKTYRQSVLKYAFEGKLTNKKVKDGVLPKGWELKTLKEIFKVSSGKGIKINQLKGGNHAVYGGNGLNGYHSEYFIEEPVLIIGRVGVKCGVTHITKPKSWVSDNALIVKSIIKDFDIKFFNLKLEFENLNKLSVSTAQPVISGNSIYSVSIELPPIKEQHRIVQEIETRLSVADKMEESIAQSLQQAEALRQSILKKAFSGELV